MVSRLCGDAPYDGTIGKDKLQNIIAIICFFLSGFAGLVYEVAWIRKASLVFGFTTFAVSTVIAVFFLGLACGSYVFGRIGQRTVRPLRLYAVLEICLGLFAVLSFYLLDHANVLYGVVYRSLADRLVLLYAVRAVFVGLILLPPTILMGGTLPLFCPQYVIDDTKITRTVGWLYGINMLGAAIGCAMAGFILLPELGLIRSVQIGAVINILCGIALWLLNVPDIHIQDETTTKKQEPSKGSWGHRPSGPSHHCCIDHRR
jgi:spermidine synthase